MQSIPEQQVVERLRSENVWWSDPSTIHAVYDGYSPRAYLDLLTPLVVDRSVHRAVVLMGPRRVGKTVLLHHVVRQLIRLGSAPAQHISFVSVDHPIYNGLGLEEIFSYLERASGIDLRNTGNAYVFFDEIQYLRDWELHLKALVDSYHDTRFVVSGSAAAALRLKSVESGAGRFTEFLLPPLTFREYLQLTGMLQLIGPMFGSDSPYEGWYRAADVDALNETFVEYLNLGGYPEVVTSPGVRRDPARFFKNDIIDKVLLRDLPSLYGIQNIQELNYLFTTLAYNTAGEVSLDELSKSSGVAKNTIRRYIEYLEAAFLVKVVHRIDRDGTRFRRATRFKVYLTNPSMRSALFSPVSSDDEAMGNLAETGIFSQWFHRPSPMYYARWKNGEVDIVNLGEDQRPAWATEVKWSNRFVDNPSELGGLIRFCKANSVTDVVVTTRTEYAVRHVDGLQILFIPASIYCYTVGRNVVGSRKVQQETRGQPDLWDEA